MGATQSTGLFSIRDVLPGVKCEKVICWVGSTDAPDRVVEVAKSFAAIGGEPCHVVMCLNPGGRDGPRDRRGRAPLTPELICSAGDRLKGLYGSEVYTVVLPGYPVTEIRRYATNHHADLIVIGEQGRKVERECGEQLMDTAPCAVLNLALPSPEGASALKPNGKPISFSAD